MCLFELYFEYVIGIVFVLILHCEVNVTCTVHAHTTVQDRSHDIYYYFWFYLDLSLGIHVEQRQLGCELLEDDIPGKMITKIAFDGVKGNEMHFNIHLRTFQSGFQCTWPGSPDTKTLQEIYAYFYHPICIRALRKCLNVGKKYLLNKGKTPSYNITAKRIIFQYLNIKIYLNPVAKCNISQSLTVTLSVSNSCCRQQNNKLYQSILYHKNAG